MLASGFERAAHLARRAARSLRSVSGPTPGTSPRRPRPPPAAQRAPPHSPISSILLTDAEEALTGELGRHLALELLQLCDLARLDQLLQPPLDPPPSVSQKFEAMVVWFNAEPLVLGRNYIVKHNVRISRAKATKISFRVDMETLEKDASHELRMNDIAPLISSRPVPLYFDPYRRNRTTGSFILIDPISNATVGAAMIDRDLSALGEEPIAAAAPAQNLWDKPIAAEVATSDTDTIRQSCSSKTAQVWRSGWKERCLRRDLRLCSSRIRIFPLSISRC